MEARVNVKAGLAQGKKNSAGNDQGCSGKLGFRNGLSKKKVAGKNGEKGECCEKRPDIGNIPRGLPVGNEKDKGAYQGTQDTQNTETELFLDDH